MDVIPQVLLAREDALRIARLIAHGEKVQMSVSLPNKVGPTITSHNVVAEIKGSDLPNEVVIFGAHLDSWNLGTGALDNGCNAALVIDSRARHQGRGHSSAADHALHSLLRRGAGHAGLARLCARSSQ